MRVVNVTGTKTDYDYMFSDMKKFAIVVIHDNGVTIIDKDGNWKDLQVTQLSQILQQLQQLVD